MISRTRFDGSLDTTFGGSGTGVAAYTGAQIGGVNSLQILGVTVDSKQRIILSGDGNVNAESNRRLVIIRLTPDVSSTQASMDRVTA